MNEVGDKSVSDFVANPRSFVRGWFRDYETLFGGSLLDLSKMHYVQFLIRIHPGIEIHIPNSNSIYYSVEDNVANHLLGAAQRIPDANDLAMEICASNIFEGKELPPAFRTMIHGLIKGHYEPAKRRGPPVSERFVLMWLAYEMALFVRDLSDGKIYLTKNEATSGDCACEIVSEILEEFGLEVSYTAIRDWCTKSKNSDFRQRCGVLTNYFKDLRLYELGVLSTEPALGLFRGMGRMTK